MKQSKIPITFDKSHLTTIGTRLYAESLDLVRELIANAYDADATRVRITLTDSELIVQDNGSGMDKEGLTQYFTIGSDYKKEHPMTPRLKRRRIGEFGIGKFAVLSLCDRFTIFTRKNGYAATVVFDKEQFESDQSWEIPVIEHESNSKQTGTKVTLNDLRYPISSELLERKLRQQLPLNQKDFIVILNGVRLTSHAVPGRRWRIRAQTEFGLVTGEIVLSSLLLPKAQVGIAIKVRQMAIKREVFDLERSHHIPIRRLTGEINANFLPLTSSRDNFIKDTKEYQLFIEIVRRKMKKIVREIRKLGQSRLDTKTDKALSNALSLVKNALKKNPDLFLMYDLPLFVGVSTKSKALEKSLGDTTLYKRLGRSVNSKSQKQINKNALTEVKHGRKNLVRTVLKDKRRTIKRIKIGGLSLVCSLSHMGKDNEESFVEGGIVFINRDHPLFKQCTTNNDLAEYHLARLITQELVKLADPKEVSRAYNWQSRLLNDALVDKKDKSYSKQQ